MKKTIALAKKGLGWTFPNPLVGAVIVKDNTILATGYHRKVGLPHAEIEAISSSRQDLQGSTLYVALEPCVHHGKTPPCADTIIKAGIKRVVCATVDPNPKVNGQGIKRLRNAGIAVTTGLLEQQARELNEAFFTFHEKKRPFIALKFAASLDGKIATKTGDSKWITNEKARNYARRLRSHYQAVLVGANTVLADNPHLGVRVKGKKDPLRIILDSSLVIPLTSNVLRNSNVLIATTEKANKQKRTTLTKRGIEVIYFDGTTIPLASLLKELRKREVISVLVEGGGTVHGSFVDEKLVDKVYAFHAPMLIGGKEAVSAVQGRGAETIKEAMVLTNVTFKRFDDTIVTIGYANDTR